MTPGLSTSVEYLGGPLDGVTQVVHLGAGGLPETLAIGYRHAHRATAGGRAAYQYEAEHSGKRNPCTCPRPCSPGCPASAP